MEELIKHQEGGRECPLSERSEIVQDIVKFTILFTKRNLQ